MENSTAGELPKNASERIQIPIPTDTGRIGLREPCVLNPKTSAKAAKTRVRRSKAHSILPFDASEGAATAARGVAAQWKAQATGAAAVHPQGCRNEVVIMTILLSSMDSEGRRFPALLVPTNDNVVSFSSEAKRVSSPRPPGRRVVASYVVGRIYSVLSPRPHRRLIPLPCPHGGSVPAVFFTWRGTMLEEIRNRIEGEIETLTHELNVLLPEQISKAVELGDLRENSEYKSALERQSFVQARIEHLTMRMSELAKINVEAMPVDRVGFGSKVTIRDLDLDEDMTFTVVAGDFMDLDGGQVSMASPIGRGLLGARAGEDVTIRLPVGERRYNVRELVTLPQQMGLAS